MSCPTSIENTERSLRKTFTNWARIFSFESRESYKPRTRGEIVELIRRAELNTDSRIKWSGSRWSFMRSFESTDVIIESDNINGLVEVNSNNPQLVQGQILSLLPLTDRGIDLFNNNNLVHIKGGTKIFNANRILHGLEATINEVNHTIPEDENTLQDIPFPINSKAFTTLGGSGGQSIAGAISSGTHGGDLRHPPIGDHIEVIHLIGPGGQEWWIEKEDGITSGTESETQNLLRAEIESLTDENSEFCSDIIVRKNDTLFNAVLVSLGRMGFIYSLIFRVETAYKLTETREESTWQEFRNSLVGNRLYGLRGERGKSIHHLNITIMPFRNSNNLNVCKIAKRVKDIYEEGGSGIPSNTEFEPKNFASSFTTFLCEIPDARLLIPVLLLILGTLGATAAGLVIAISVLSSIWIVGWALAAAAAVVLAGVVASIALVTGLIAYLISGPRRSLRETIGAVSDVATRLGLGDLVITYLTALFDAAYPITNKDGNPYRRTDFSWKIMDTYPYGPETFCEKVNSMDFAFSHDRLSTNTPQYFSFIDDVLDVFEDLRSRKLAIAGNLALRYSLPTVSMLGMSKHSCTCHIEIASLRDFPGSTEFVERVQLLAKNFNAVPSWGQLINHYNAGDIRLIHGDNLLQWRTKLTELITQGRGQLFTFSNRFTRTYNLEPLDPDSILIKQLNIEVEIGSDGIRGQDFAGTSHLLGDLSLTRESTIMEVIEFNNIGTRETPNWRGWNSGIHNVVYGFPEPIVILDINRLAMYMPAAGGAAGDNVDINRVVVRAVSIDDTECIIGRINTPFRLTGNNERVEILFNGCI